MSTVHAPARGLATSGDGRWLVWSDAARLILIDLAKPTRLIETEIAIEPPCELVISTTTPQRLLVLQAKGGSTLMRVFSLPDSRPVVESRLKGEVRFSALCGSVAVLGGTETLTAFDLLDLRSTSLQVRGPIQVVAAISADQLLVGARGKLETWNLAERRPSHRLGLPLPSDAGFGGVVANGRLLWIASSAAPGAIALFRLSDGKQLEAPVAGGTIKYIVGDAASTTVAAAVQPDGGGPLQLVVLDLETKSHRVVAFDRSISTFCFTGAPTDGIAVLPDDGPPVLFRLTIDASPRLVPHALARTTADVPDDPRQAALGEVASAPATPDGATATAAEPPATTNDLADRLSVWRSQVQAAIVATPPKPIPAGERARGVFDEPRSRSRAEIYAWGQSARARTTTTPPPPPQGWRLSDLTVRFKLEMRSRSLLALLYSGWLDGEGRTGVSVAVIARALGNDEEAWIEALAQGRLGRIGWIRTSYGRTRLHPVVGHFLDESPARLLLVAPTDASDSSLALPLGPALWQLPDPTSLDEAMRDLANRSSAPMAVIDVSTLPAVRHERALADRLLEARLHGALPIVIPFATRPFDPRLLDGPAVIAIDTIGTSLPPEWRALPVWPPPPPPPVDAVVEEELATP